MIRDNDIAMIRGDIERAVKCHLSSYVNNKVTDFEVQASNTGAAFCSKAFFQAAK